MRADYTRVKTVLAAQAFSRQAGKTVQNQSSGNGPE
jgi:hypothetical protein